MESGVLLSLSASCYTSFESDPVSLRMPEKLYHTLSSKIIIHYDEMM